MTAPAGVASTRTSTSSISNMSSPTIRGCRASEWQDAYRQAWRTYYTEEHMKTVIRRAGGERHRASTRSRS